MDNQAFENRTVPYMRVYLLCAAIQSTALRNSGLIERNPRNHPRNSRIKAMISRQKCIKEEADIKVGSAESYAFAMAVLNSD